jgi:hypothetical protein
MYSLGDALTASEDLVQPAHLRDAQRGGELVRR